MYNYMKTILSAVKVYIDKIAVNISNKIPTKNSQLENDAGYLTEQINADWNENDKTSKAYISNRPFYEETTETELILLDTNHDFTTGSVSLIYSLANVETGSQVAIIVDNDEYTATVYYQGNPVYDYYLDNYSEGCPINCMFGDVSDTSGSLGNVHIKIYCNVVNTSIYKIDEKYLPELNQVGATTENGGEIFNSYGNYSYSNNAGYYAHAEGYKTTASGAYSHAEGYDTIASGEKSHAEGTSTASGYASHAEGFGKASEKYAHAEGTSTASGDFSHAEGQYTEASGYGSHAEGGNSTASGTFSHAEGRGTTAIGDYSHAEGSVCHANGYASHAEGADTIASGEYQHVQGKCNIEDTENKYAHIVGNGIFNNTRSNAHTLDWNGNAWFAGDVYIGGTGQDDTENIKKLLSESDIDKKPGEIIFGVNNSVLGELFNEASEASGEYSHAEGLDTASIGKASHAEGEKATANGWGSHAEGYNTTASGTFSHAEGQYTEASGYGSHAEGDHTTASGLFSHAEGHITIASGIESHAEGNETIASGNYQHVEGRCNIADVDSTYIHIAGNGKDDTIRSNAHTLDWEGNAWFSGDVYVGSTSGTNKDEGSVKLVTETELSNYYLKTEADTLHTELHNYVDTEVAALVNSAPETLDTLGELATAFNENKEVVEALDEAITTKANQSDLTALSTTVASHTTALNAIKEETWTFTLDNGSTVTKKVAILS